MQGFISLDNEIKKIVQKNIKNMQKGGVCPFLIEKSCSVYKYRPIICRTHGLAYLYENNTVKVPYCVNEGKNYSSVFDGKTVTVSPISENLETKNILKSVKDNEIRNLYDWIKIL